MTATPPCPYVSMLCFGVLKNCLCNSCIAIQVYSPRFCNRIYLHRNASDIPLQQFIQNCYSGITLATLKRCPIKSRVLVTGAPEPDHKR